MATPWNEEELDYRLLSRNHVDEALAVQALTMREENLARGVGMFEEPGAPEEMTLVFREVIKDGATLVAVHRATGDLAAVAFNKIHARPTAAEEEGDEMARFVEKNLGHRSCRELVKFVGDIEDSVDIFGKYRATGAMELFYLGTNPRYQGQGLGRRMVEKCIEFGRGLLHGSRKRRTIDGEDLDRSPAPELIYGVFASNYSQRIADKLGFETLREVRYEDYTYFGKRMADRIGDVHKTARLQALKL